MKFYVMSQSSIAGMQIRTKGLWCPRGNEVPGYWDGQRRFQGWYKFCLFLKGRYKLNRLKMNQRRTWPQISGVWIHVKRIMNRNILCKSFTYYKLKICLRIKVVTFQSFFFLTCCILDGAVPGSFLGLVFLSCFYAFIHM